jgi:hypothetical protein
MITKAEMCRGAVIDPEGILGVPTTGETIWRKRVHNACTEHLTTCSDHVLAAGSYRPTQADLAFAVGLAVVAIATAIYYRGQTKVQQWRNP